MPAAAAQPGPGPQHQHYHQQQPPPATGYVPQQRPATGPTPAPETGAANQPPATLPPPAPPGGGGERTGPPVGVIVGLVLIGATVLVLGALSVPFLLDRLDGSGEGYAIGDCVVQDGTTPKPVECTEPGAFQVVAQVDSQEQCEDQTQPSIQVPGPPQQVYCLAPAAADPTG